MSTRIVFESEGFRQILLSDGCKKLVQDTSEEICARANSQGSGEFGTDLIVGGYGEFKYGIENYPEEYAGRYFKRDLESMEVLLDSAGARRVFYVNVRPLEKKPFPAEWTEKNWVRRVVSKKGVTIVELDK
jgi:hypothetical protein